MTRLTEIVVAAVTLILLATGCTSNPTRLTLVGSDKNDVYVILQRAGERVARFDDLHDAIEHAPNGSGVLVMADQYPQKRITLNDAFFKRVREKRVRLYVEYPSMAPGVKFGEVQKAAWERGVVASDAFGETLAKNRIVAVHGCSYLPISPSPGTPGEGRGEGLPLLVIARVAGYDTAIYGLPEKHPPLLLEAGDGQWLIATTKLSNFVTGRYAPTQDWKTIWTFILTRFDPGHEYKLDWEPVARPACAQHDKLPTDIEHQTFSAAAQFYQHARLLIPKQRADQIRALLSANSEDIPVPATDEEGDGSLGMQEGYSSGIDAEGNQLQRVPVRTDCNAEAAMVMAMDWKINGNARSRKVSENLLDYVFSPAMQGKDRLDPHHPAFGLIAWGAISPAWQVANYGDDDARVILATLAASASLNTDRWAGSATRALLANLRTTGKKGFRPDRIDMPDISARGWKYFHDWDGVSYSPHFESYLWACFLWAHHHTGETEFLDKARTAITMTMQAYPAQWQWQNNLQRARMLLCLAWLVREDDTPQHRKWLFTMAHDLLLSQQRCGAIQETLSQGGGFFSAPQSNEAYGTGETPLAQQNGDPVSDQLYTSGFALLGLHEAVAATGDASLKTAEGKLAEFLCRIQIRSERLPYLNGTWFRAFDHKRWECYASSADAGWGAWSVEAGWAQAWTAAVLAMRQQNTNLWTLTEGSHIQAKLSAVQKEMSINDGVPPDSKIRN